MDSKDARKKFIEKGYIFGVVWPCLIALRGLYRPKRAIIAISAPIELKFSPEGSQMDSKDARKIFIEKGYIFGVHHSFPEIILPQVAKNLNSSCSTEILRTPKCSKLPNCPQGRSVWFLQFKKGVLRPNQPILGQNIENR